jgi:UDP-N-acetyl-D-glucosamine dehydrogenase
VSYIVAASEAVAKTLRKGQVVILKSTTYPDTTEGVVLPILKKAAEERGLTLGEDYFLAFSPERVDPGNKVYTTATTPIVVGGVTEACTKVAQSALKQIIGHVHVVSSPRVAEMEKLLENIFRSVNIALANEMAQLCDRMGGISFWEVVEAAGTKPFGFMPFVPGPGLGGHCIPIDPYYLSWLARRYDFETSFITLSAHTNESMPFYVVEGILRAIAEQPIRLSEAKVLLVGAAFKKNVSDIRHSPTLKVIELLQARGVNNVSYSDSWVPSLSERQGEMLIEMESVDLNPDSLKAHDVVVILTEHDNVDYQMIADNSAMVVDTRNAMKTVDIDETKLMLLGGGDF